MHERLPPHAREARGRMRLTPRLRLTPAIVHQDKRSSEHLENMQRLFPGVHGRVIELCKPSQKKYNAAVTIAMGKNMDAIVVDNEAAAQDCIRYLKEKKVRDMGTLLSPTLLIPPTQPQTRTHRTPPSGHTRSPPPTLPPRTRTDNARPKSPHAPPPAPHPRLHLDPHPCRARPRPSCEP